MFSPTVYDGSIFPHPCQHLLLSSSFEHHLDVKWYFHMVLTCISSWLWMLRMFSCACWWFVRLWQNVYFLLFCGLSFRFLDTILWSTNFLKFWWNSMYVFLSFIPCNFSVISKKSLPNPGSQRFMHVLCSRSFIIVALAKIHIHTLKMPPQA